MPALRLLTRMELCGSAGGRRCSCGRCSSRAARWATHEALKNGRRGGIETSARALRRTPVRHRDGARGRRRAGRPGAPGGRARGALSGTPLGVRAAGGAQVPPARGQGRRRAWTRRWKAGQAEPVHLPRETFAEGGRGGRRGAVPRRCHRGGEFLAGERRRRAAPPSDRRALRLWAPSSARVIPLEPVGLEPDTDAWTSRPSRRVRADQLLTKRKPPRSARRRTPSGSATIPPARVRTPTAAKSDEAGLLRRYACGPRRRIGCGAALARAGGRGSSCQRAASFVPLRPNTVYRKHVDGSWPEAVLTTKASTWWTRATRSKAVALTPRVPERPLRELRRRPSAPWAGNGGEVRAVAVEPREGAALCFPHGDAESTRPCMRGARCSRAPNGAGTITARTDVLFQLGKG